MDDNWNLKDRYVFVDNNRAILESDIDILHKKLVYEFDEWLEQWFAIHDGVLIKNYLPFIDRLNKCFGVEP